MSKLIQAILSGMLITFIADFFLFLGIKLHYIDANNIDEYYNILFADHQNIYIYFALSIILGYLIIYRSNKTALIGVGIVFFLASLSLIPPIGKSIGEVMLMSHNVTLKTSKYTYTGDIQYTARKVILFYDYKLQKVIKLEKNKLISE